jgi:predicted alpha/beta hydrolase
MPTPAPPEESALKVQSIPTADGVAITATFHGETHPLEGLRGAVLMVPAMGTPQRYYTACAAWLAQQGYKVATFDYRGTGLSRPQRLRGFQADILTWARLDCAAMVAAVRERAPGRPLYWIGHSLGCQILPFVPDPGRITRVVSVASGSGYWRENAPALRRRAPLLWHVLAPVSTALCGYFPGKRLRVIGDLPAGVVRQWRRWCLHPQYALSEGEWARERFAAITRPITFFSFTDDEFMSERSGQSLSRWYVNAPQTDRRISPASLGVARIGHFGFFRESFAGSLWQQHLLPELVPPQAHR